MRAQLPPFGALPEVAEIPLTRTGRLQSGDLALARGGRFSVEHRVVPGPVGQPAIAVLICRPTRIPAGAVTAGVYHVHGGGMISGDRTTGMEIALDWAEYVDLTIVSVEYRLAPETPHPGPVEDCYAGLVWTAGHAAELGIDPSRLIVAGGSAGGGLAAATVLMARDLGGPEVFAQLLMCPMLDDRNDSVSARQLEGHDTWDRRNNEIAWTAVLGEARGGEGVSPYAAPARAGDLSRLPPTYLDVGSCETFRDEVVDYALRLWHAGGDCELHVWPGGFHGFAGIAPMAMLSRQASAAPITWLGRILSR